MLGTFWMKNNNQLCDFTKSLSPFQPFCPLLPLCWNNNFFFLVYVFEKFIRTSFVTLWDEEKLDGFYIDENLMKRERRSVEM